MKQATTKRRRLQLETLDDVVCECRSLLADGYVQRGNWSIGQICRHLRLSQDASIDGYPRWTSLFAPSRPIFRWFLLPRLLRGQSPAGMPTLGILVPPNNLIDETELQAFEGSVQRFLDHKGEYRPHPGFGRMDRASLEGLHAAHAAHHLGFLHPADETSDS